MNEVLNRGTGLLIINVMNSNPNGDPDAESEPRTFEADGRGLISPVSFKRKVRDLLEDEDGPVRAEALRVIGACSDRNKYGILESRGRERKTLEKMDALAFIGAYWDARVFGSTFLEKGAEKIRTGVVQIGPGVSVAPIDIVRLTLTNKAGVQKGKDRGMAPLAFRVVRHGLYAMPFFVNPSAAHKSGCTTADIDVLKFLIPLAYAHTASAMRPQVEIVHAWYAEHKSPLGSCPDPLILSALQPIKRGNPEESSRDISDYDIPDMLPDHLRDRLSSFEDLATKDWAV
ncbi:MAG: type I CRISPR-associated protein Cas7 [Thermomicrobiales bacterium]